MTPRGSRVPARITVRVEENAWRTADVKTIRAAAIRALGRGRGEATLLLASDNRLAELNAKFRARPVPTNVLAFPSAEASGYLGDVAIAHGVAAREAALAGKPLAEHAAHLAVHGVLHLLGYDHRKSREARVMERLETAILAGMGIADPYAAAE